MDPFVLPNTFVASPRSRSSHNLTGHAVDAASSRAYREYNERRLRHRTELDDHKVARERVLCDLYYAKAYCKFGASFPSDSGRAPSLPDPRVPQSLQASFLSSHAIAETAEDPPTRSSPEGSSASLAAESEDEDDCPPDAYDTSLDISPILHAIPGVVVPPRQEGGKIGHSRSFHLGLELAEDPLSGARGRSLGSLRHWLHACFAVLCRQYEGFQ